MPRKIKIAWDISHLEFTIEDHYYFSILKSKIKEAGALVKEIGSFQRIVDYDVAVLNYPEEPFKREEVRLVQRYLNWGGKVIIAGYYNNEDRIADRINSISSHFGLVLKTDRVRDRSSNDEGDDLLPVTSRILSYNNNVTKALFPCSASVDILASMGKPIVVKETLLGSNSKTIIGAEVSLGGGKLILLGSCVFWDNFAIRKYSNLMFSLNLLLS